MKRICATRRDLGFVNLELMLLIGLVGIGAVIALPSLMKVLRHQPVSTGNWAAIIIGALLALFGVAPFVLGFFSSVFGKSDRR